MKRIFFTFAVAVMTVSAYADAYTDELATYLSQVGVVKQESYRKTLLPTVKNLFEYNEYKASSIVSEYVSQQLLIDMTEVYQPIYKSFLSKSELKALNKAYADPQFAQKEAVSMELYGNILSPQVNKNVALLMERGLNAYKEGKTPEDFATPSDIEQDYIETFVRYYEGAKLDKIASSRLQAELLKGWMAQNGVANADEAAGDFASYLKRNMPMAMVQLYKEQLTKEDLQLLIKNTSTPAYHHSLDAAIYLKANAATTNVQFYRKFAAWLTERYPKNAEPLNEWLKTHP
jgi:hypothetical protein